MKFLFLSSSAHLVLDPAAKQTPGGAELQFALLAAELAKRGHQVTIVGGDDGQPADRTLQGVWDSVESRARTLANVEFLRRVPYPGIQQWSDRAEIFVNTSEAEGFPNSFIQAAQGSAAILSLAVDPDTVLTRYGTGRCAGDDGEKFFAEAARLMRDRGARGVLQSQAEKFVTALHDNGKNVDSFLAGLTR
jgi:Glycosyl transferases group 1